MKQIKDKTGSVPLYLVVTAIIIVALLTMGILFTQNINGSVNKSIDSENSGFSHMSDEGGAHSLR